MLSDIRVRPVASPVEMLQFIDFPWKIYKGDKNWVPPLKAQTIKLLDKSRNPVWEHAERELFMAWQDGMPAGRIVAIVNQNHNRTHKDKAGFFGFFECINDSDISKALFDAAKKWVGERGMTVLRGPVNPTMNDEIGFLLEGFGSPPVIMMPYTPEYYLDLAGKYGMRKAKDLYAFFKDSSTGIPVRVERIKRKTRVEIRSLDKKNFRRDVEIIKGIYNKAWEKNWGNVPMTEKEMDILATTLRNVCEPELVKFAFVKGTAVGVSIVLPNLNELFKKFNGSLNLFNRIRFLAGRGKIKGIRAMVFGFIEGFRQTGLPLVLYFETERSGRKLGYQWVEISWNLEDNDLINKFAVMIGARIYKKYRIYETPV
jgi:hypothetical protein